jgi:hypothetical protein
LASLGVHDCGSCSEREEDARVRQSATEAEVVVVKSSILLAVHMAARFERILAGDSEAGSAETPLRNAAARVINLILADIDVISGMCVCVCVYVCLCVCVYA